MAPGGGDQDAMSTRLRDAIRRLELIGGRLAEDALAKAAEVLEAAAHQRAGDGSGSIPARRVLSGGSITGPAGPAMEVVQLVEVVGDRQTGQVTFPAVSVEGSQWVDAGTVSLVVDSSWTVSSTVPRQPIDGRPCRWR